MALVPVLFVALALHASDPWTVRADGVGPVQVGMSLSSLNRLLHTSYALPPADTEERDCFYVGIPNHHDAAVMILHGRVGRVDVVKSSTATAEGAHVGDSEAHIQKLYGANLGSEPSHYDGDAGGRYLTYRKRGTSYAIRFETWDGKVTSYYAGTIEAISLVEGCA